MTRFNFFFLILSSFFLVACGGSDNGSKTEDVADTQFENLTPFQVSTYSQNIKSCVAIIEASESCTMNKLPLIGQVTTDPTESDILGRVIVSHQWMGDNFKSALSKMPDDMKLLFRSVTAIVIDESIRPSFYRPLTGAIYLDPANLWLTNDQKADIQKDDDYRSSFGNALSFKEFNLYTFDGLTAFNTSGTIYNDVERGINDVIGPLSRLLFHELAHANDYASILHMANFNRADTIVEAIEKNWNNGNLISYQLSVQDPLTSLHLHSLADVRFRGEDPTETEKIMSATYVGALFASEGAVSHYNYSTEREDIAMLFEAGMMKYHFDVDKDQAFVSYPEDETNPVCADYVVGGGSRNKIANPLVTNRMITVFEYIFPDRTYSSLVDNWIGEETPKSSGKDWCENLISSSARLEKNTGTETDQSAIPFNLHDLTNAPNQSASRRIQD